MSRRLGIVTALAPEAALVQRLLHRAVHRTVPYGALWQGQVAGLEVVVLRCGMGAARATQGALWLSQHTPLWGLLSVGFAGGLQPSVTSGDAILVTQVVAWNHVIDNTPAGSAVIPIAPCLRRLAAKAAAHTAASQHCGALLSVPTLAADAATKQRLGRVSGALAVDMESYGLGQLAAQQQLAFMTLRTIFDPVTVALPFHAEAFTTPDGALQPGRLWQYLWRHPALLAHIPPAWWQSRVAGRTLQRWLLAFVTLLAEQGLAHR